MYIVDIVTIRVLFGLKWANIAAESTMWLGMFRKSLEKSFKWSTWATISATTSCGVGGAEANGNWVGGRDNKANSEGHYRKNGFSGSLVCASQVSKHLALKYRWDYGTEYAWAFALIASAKCCQFARLPVTNSQNWLLAAVTASASA